MEHKNTLGVIDNTALSKCWGAELAQLDGAYSENTIRAYRADYAHFETWCAGRHILPMPTSAEVIAEYITALSDQRAPATIRRRLVGISRVHQLCGAPDVAKSHVIRLALRRILRARGQRQK